MKSGSSAFIGSGLQSGFAAAISSWYQTSRPGAQPILPPVRRTTSTFLTITPCLRGDVDRLVGVFLQRNRLAAAQALVGGDDEGRFAVDDAAGQRVRREAAEDDRMDRADARAGEHRIGRFGDHRHVDGDAVALLDAVLLQHVGEPADMVRRARR